MARSSMLSHTQGIHNRQHTYPSGWAPSSAGTSTCPHRPRLALKLELIEPWTAPPLVRSSVAAAGRSCYSPGMRDAVALRLGPIPLAALDGLPLMEDRWLTACLMLAETSARRNSLYDARLISNSGKLIALVWLCDHQLDGSPLIQPNLLATDFDIAAHDAEEYGLWGCGSGFEGVVGLRVVDASVIPVVTAGHTQFAERASGLIKAFWSI
ncbi:hypothetical protein BDZ97DRAFT_1918447 [Flammula alnicola]|nr:hypothetical protein BDZ97DRAFT_1918447 [Flammula alnicola]